MASSKIMPFDLRAIDHRFLRSLAWSICICALAATSALCCSAQTLPNDPGTALPTATGGSLDDLVAAGEYHDALAMIASEQPPYDLPTSLARAELLLMAGESRESAAEFRRVRALTPAGEPLADYGDALCALMQGNTHDSAVDLRRCTASAAYSSHREEIDLAYASLGKTSDEAPLASGAISEGALAGSLLAQELESLKQFRSRDVSVTGESSPWMLPGGVPRVSEPFGLRAAALVARAAGMSALNSPLIVAPLAGGDAASQIRSALLPGEHPAPGAPPAKPVSGWVILSPPPGIRNSQDALATFLIDGNVVAVINSDSMAYRWDTSRFQNGRHTVQIEIGSSEGQANTQEFTRYYDVHNKSGAANLGESSVDFDKSRPIQLSVADQAVVGDAWSILALQPDYAAGERVLAAQARRTGNAGASLYHSACAEAIEFDGDPAFLRRLSGRYAGRLPLIFADTLRTHSRAESTTFGLWRGNLNLREVALTFDDGPSPTATAALLNELRGSKAIATFFVVGARAQLAPDLVRRMHQEGHEVEDHSYSHPNLDEATPQHVYEEILRNAVVVESLTGVWPHFLRPPGGQSNSHVLEDAGRCGLTGAFWTIDALSAEDSGSPGAVTRFVMKRIKPGAVVLMHNGPYATARAVPQLVAQLRAQGYSLVTLQRLALDAARH